MTEIHDAELEEAGPLHEEVSAYLEFWAIALDGVEDRLALDDRG